VGEIMALKEEVLAKWSREPPLLTLIQFIIHSFMGHPSQIPTWLS